MTQAVRCKQLGSAGKDTNGYALALDTGGNVYAVGTTTGALSTATQTGTTDAFIAKYSNAGALSWVQQLGVTGKNTDAYGSGSLGGIAITGLSDAWIAKYSAAGEREVLKLLGVASKYTASYAIGLDCAGSALIAGYTQGSLAGTTITGSFDAFIAKYDSTGTRL